MSEEIGIVMTLQDKVSSTLNSIGNNTKAFNKDLQELEQRVTAYDQAQDKLSKNAVELRQQLEAVNVKVKDAQKAYKKLKDEGSKGALDGAIQEQAELKRQLGETESAMKSNQKALGNLMDQTRKAGNQSYGIGGTGDSSLLSALGKAGITQMLGQTVSGIANTLVSSAYGSEAGGIFSSALSGAASGAAIGSIVPGVGTAVGAAVGGGLGLAQGVTQMFQARDDAYKSYVQDQYSAIGDRRTSELESGSTIAGGREGTRMAFNKLLGGEDAAGAYLKQVQTLAVDTNYTYDEITGYTKKLLNSFQSGTVLDILQELSDATAGLSLSSSDVDMFVAGLNRMETTGKATREYLNYFDDRGLDTSAALSSYLGKDKSSVSDLVTKGKISGQTAVEAIRAYIQSQYGGLSVDLAGSHDAMVNNLGDLTDNINATLGDAYNDKSKSGIQADLDAYGGKLGDAMESMNSMIGEGKGISENLSRQYQREAMSALLMGTKTTVYDSDQAEQLAQMHTDYTNLVDQYNNASSDKDKATFAGQIEALKGQAEAMADSSYTASDTMQNLNDTEQDLISAIQDMNIKLGAWTNSYTTQQNLSKGQGGSFLPSQARSGTILTEDGALIDFSRHAFGLGRVPYNGYPALLDEGERVLTASQARQQDNSQSSAQVVINGPVTVREEADLDKLARKFAAELWRAKLLSTGG